MTTLPNKTINTNPMKKNALQQSMDTLNQLALRPNITIKRKIIIKNCSNNKITVPHNKITDSQSKSTTSQNKSTTSQNKSTTSQNKSTNSQNKETSCRNKVTGPQHQVSEGKKENEPSKNMAVKRNGQSIEKLNGEYYPERRKRSVQAKKIKLRVKHEYKVVAATNKRKRRIPCKGTGSIYHPPQREVQFPGLVSSRPPEPSLSSLVQLVEEQGLGDEDFLEILTCPSPVWWEDSSDEDDDSFEDLDGGSTGLLQNDQQKEKKIKTNANKMPARDKTQNDNNILKKFASKRSKLENILGNIKCKKTKSEEKQSDEKDFSIEENVNKIRENMSSTEPNKYDNENEIVNEESTVEFGNRIRKDSPGCLSDISFNEEELLKTLENTELPVKNINKTENDGSKTNEIVMMEIDKIDAEKKKTNLNNVSNKRKRTRKPRNNNESKCKRSSVKKNNDKSITDFTNEADLCIVPKDLPPLTKNPFKTIPKAYESPKSIESFNSETTSFEFDSISDTNIKFLDEYVDIKKESNEAVNVNKYEKGQDGELVTVYQIVNKPDDMDLDIEQQIKVNLVNKSPQISVDVNKNYGDIDTFFKTRKSAFRSRSKYKRK